MDKAAMVKEYLDGSSIPASSRTETVYRYHAELEAGCRLAGCEIVMRTVGEDVIVKAELPISVMTKETRGVVKFLADVNKKRVEDEKQGYFDLDYIAGKILFGMVIRQPEGAEALKEAAAYCIDEVEALSDELLKVVCAEHEAVLHEEEYEEPKVLDLPEAKEEPAEAAIAEAQPEDISENAAEITDETANEAAEAEAGAEESDGEQEEKACIPAEEEESGEPETEQQTAE